MSAVRERPLWTAAALVLAVLVIGILSPTVASLGLGAHWSPSRLGAARTAVPAANGFTVSPNPDDTGVSATFNASGACLAVVGTCNYSYTGLPAGCASTSASFSCAPSATGQFDVNVTASWACPICVTNSASLTFTVNAYPSITSVTAAPANLDVGQATTLNVSTAGGSEPISYVWSNLPNGCGSADTNSLRCRPSVTGTFAILVGLSDSVGGQANGSVSISVASRLVVTLGVTPPVRDLGGSVTFTVTVSGGQAPFGEAYTGLPAGCTSASTTTLTCTPTQLGTFSVTVTATDSVQSQASAGASLEVVGAPTATLSATPSMLDVGQTMDFVTSVSGGSGGDRYAYANLPTGCTNGNLSTFTCAPTAAGSYSVSVTVTDADGNTASATTSVTINPPLTANVAANVTSGLTPLPVSFTGRVGGGTAPFQYAWLFAPNASSNLTAPRFVFVAPGNYSVSLTITDSVGASVSAFLQITVNPTSNLPTYTISFFVNPSGCGPITLDSILLRDGSTQPLPAATYPAIAPSCPGFAFTQWVPSGSLLVGNPANASTDVTVEGGGSITAVLTAIPTHGAPPTGGFSIRSLSSWIPYIPLLIGAVLALYLIVHYLGTRETTRRPSTGDGRDEPPGPASPVSPPPGAPTAPPVSIGRGPGQPGERSAPPVGAPGGKSPASGGIPWDYRPGVERSLPRHTEPASLRPIAPPSPSRPTIAAPSRLSNPPVPNGTPAARPLIAPPGPRTGASAPAAPPPPAPRSSEPPSLGAERPWPPSRIWDMAAAPNSPQKPVPRRTPRDEP